MAGISIDRCYHPSQAIHEPPGFRLIVVCLRFLRTGALLWLGVECKTWVWINRVSYGKSLRNVRGFQYGNTDVIEANKVADVVALLCLMCSLGERHYVIENPMSILVNESG